MQLCDTHCHLDDKRFEGDFEAVLERAKKAGITRFVIPAAHLEDLERARELAHKYEEVYFASGLHPNYAYLYDEEFLKSFLGDEKCVAVGECGLDYYRLEEVLAESKLGSIEELKRIQKEVFVAQIKLAMAYEKPLIVHIREASSDSLEILQKYAKDLKKGGVLHCFSGSKEQAREFIKLGYKIAFGGVLTFKNSIKTKEVLLDIDLENIVFETDAPYLAPTPYRGKINLPEYIFNIVQEASLLKKVDFKELSKITYENSLKIFHVKRYED